MRKLQIFKIEEPNVPKISSQFFGINFGSSFRNKQKYVARNLHTCKIEGIVPKMSNAKVLKVELSSDLLK